MTAAMNNSRPPAAAPVLFALLGLIALATAALLVFAGGDRRGPAPEAACPQCPPAPAVASSPRAPTPAEPAQPAAPEQPAEPAPPDAPEQPAEPPQAIAEPAAPAQPAPAPSGSGPWTIAFDPDGREPDAAGQQAIAAITAYLAADPSTRATLTGINNPKKSSKRAKQAARKVRDLIATGDVSPKRIATAVDQPAGTEGLTVRAEVEGGAR